MRSRASARLTEQGWGRGVCRLGEGPAASLGVL
jgi:hypothetical protein